MHNLLAIILFGFVSTFTPGPNNIMLMNSGSNFGIYRSLPHCIGVALGFSLMMLITAFGFGVFLLQYHWILEVLKFLGVVYLLYLAIKIFLSTPKFKSKKEPKPFGFIQAMLFQWVNPKAWITSVSAVSIFIAANSHYTLQAFYLTAILFIVCLPSAASWLFFGAGIKRLLQNEKQKFYFNVLMSALLLLAIGLIILE